MKRAAEIFCAMFLLFAANYPAAAQAKIKADDIRKIILEDGDGFCFDCERATTVRSDGTASYAGGKNSRVRAGRFAGAIGKKEFARLAKRLVDAGFFNLRNRRQGAVSDAATVKITIFYGAGKSKTIENFGASGARRILKIQNAVKSAVAGIAWRKSER